MESPDDFKKLKPTASPGVRIVTRPATANDPVAVLGDGKLAASYGPVFSNGVTGFYQLDLGSAQELTAIRTWSFNRGNKRAAQSFTLYGSAAESDPGWDPSRYTPIGSIETRGMTPPRFLATALNAPSGASLGKYRWILWAPSPLNAIGENTAFQEFAVETSR